MNARIGAVLVAVLVLVFLAACGGGGANVNVNDPWVRPAVMTGGEMQGEGEMEGEMAGEMEGEMQGEGEMSGMHGGGSNSAAYMTLVNTGDTAAAVVSASTDAASTVELHTTEMSADGVMSMRPVQQIEIPAGGETTLQPGGLHVMLLDITRDLEEGDTVELTLTLESGEEIEVEAPVRQQQ